MPTTLTNAEYRRFKEAFDALAIPADYDRYMLEASALGNACDVPADEVVSVAIATAEMYIDQREMAEEAGIINL